MKWTLPSAGNLPAKVHSLNPDRAALGVSASALRLKFKLPLMVSGFGSWLAVAKCAALALVAPRQ